MSMDLENVDLPHLRSEVERLRGELEQAAVALEDMNEWASRIAASNEQLSVQIQVEIKARHEAEKQLTEVLSKPQPDLELHRRQEEALKAQLSVTLEELQVMAEEFQASQEELRRLKQDPRLGGVQKQGDGARGPRG